jgi:hypothetical protein
VRTGLAPGVRLRRRLERGRYGAGRVELATALVTAVAAGRIYPDAAGHQAADVHPGGLVGEPAVFCGVASTRGRWPPHWLAEEQRAEAARARQEGLFEPLTDRELTILRMMPRPRCANSQPTCS